MTGALTNKPRLSIIVPVLNEIDFISDFISHLENVLSSPQEIIFVDGYSSDGTWEFLQTQKKENTYQTQSGRAYQMNFGVTKATCEWLYFVHVDSRLPQDFDAMIIAQMAQGAKAGCFRLKFDVSNWILKCAAAGSRWNILLCRGGDQTRFVTKEIFDTIEGFNTDYIVCEDIQFVKKLYEKVPFTVLPHFVITSSRRFYKNGIYPLLFHFGMIHILHWMGARPHVLYKYYSRNIN